MLGVDPGAGIDQIRDRYRALARELHPDRRAAAGDRADDARPNDMAAVNQAWAVLGDPARRAAYDRQLRWGATTAQSARTATPRYGPANPPPTHEAAPLGCLASTAGFLPWLALLVVLAAIFVFTAYAATDGGDGDDTVGGDGDAPPMVAVRDLRGSCIQEIRGAPMVVDCFTVPHEGVIVAQAAPGAGCPEGTVEWLIRHQDVLACTEQGSEARAP